jgi:hypothetical protein
MATFTVTHHQRLSNVAVVQTLENTDIAVGQSITLTGLGHGLNGTHIVFAVPTYYLIDVDEEGDYIYDPDVIIPNQLLFQDAGDDLERSAADPCRLARLESCLHLDRCRRSDRVSRHQWRDR